MDSTQYKKVIWSYQNRHETGALHLGPADLDHLKQIHKKYAVQIETVPYVRVEFLLQKEKLARYIIKELDSLLAVGGTFDIVIMDSKSHSSYTRSRDQVKYEMAISTNGRYQLFASESSRNHRTLRLSYKKTNAMLPKDDTIDKWSFGIITNGKKINQVEQLIASIAKQQIPHYEILICGPHQTHHEQIVLTMLDDVILQNDIRAPISAKKNKIIRAAKYNNLCILHDRFSLPDHWYQQFKQYGNYFEFLCLPTVDQFGNRFSVDWMRFCHPLTKRCTFNQSTNYSEWSENQIIQGGVILGKRHLMLQSMLDERLHWEELEDMQFSKMVYLNGALINTDNHNAFISEAHHHRPENAQPSTMLKFKAWMTWLRGVCSHFIKFNYYIRMH